MELLPCPFCGSDDIEEDYTCVTVKDLKVWWLFVRVNK